MSKAVSATRRTDIEGLRGLAIILVMVFHIWFGKVSGGVDVFLAISGLFFFTALVTYPMKNSTPQARAWKTLKRLTPPMAAAIGGTLLMIRAFVPDGQLLEPAKQAVASMFFMQNWYLGSKDLNYATASEHVSPLQHLWSMAIQGQIFIGAIAVFTLLGFLVHRFKPEWDTRKFLLRALVGLTAASFIWALIIHGINPDKAYYNTFARFWELGLPGLVGIFLLKKNIPFLYRQIIGIAGVVTLLSSGFILNGAKQFPGVLALVPICAGLAVVLSGNGTREALSTKLMNTAPLQFIGSHAYGLYLWHWPILIVFLARKTNADGSTINHVSLIEGMGIIALAMILAYISKKTVEVVHAEWWKNLPLASVTAVALSMSVMLAFQQTSQVDKLESATKDTIAYPGALQLEKRLQQDIDFPSMPLSPPLATASKDVPRTSKDGRCFNDTEESDLRVCEGGDPNGTKTLAVVGGSHIEQWLAAIDPIAEKHKIKLKTILKGGCPIATGDQATKPCMSWREEAINWIIQNKPDAVITNSTRPEAFGKPDFVPPSYVEAFKKIDAAGIPIIGVRDNPWFIKPGQAPTEIPDCVAANKKDPSVCSMPRSVAFQPINPAVQAMSGLANFKQMDLTDWICGPINCDPIYGNVLVYRDSHHLTQTYVKTIIPEFERQLQLATGWY